jgi:PAS domain S-box-containing protein
MRQQQATGTEVYDVPPVSIPCLIIADMNGVVKEASPAIAPVLHWLPRDVRGKNVEMLIPERFREAHRAGLERFRTTMQPPWPERSIVTYALAKDGSEVPVAISLTSFPVGANDWLLSATVRRRHAVTDPPSGIYRNGGLMDRGRDAEPDDALSLGGGT